MIDMRTARPAVWTLTVLLTAMPLAGCYGGPSIDPQLEAQRRELSKQTIDTRGTMEDTDPADESEAASDPGDAAMDEETTPAPLDDPQPAEPAPVRSDAPESDDSVRCGNRVLDDDELCEIGIPEGEEGACPSECGVGECLEVHGCRTVCLPYPPDANGLCPQ